MRKKDEMTTATPTRSYMNIDQCCKLIGAGRTSVKAAAHKFGIGIFVGDKLVALSKADAKKLRSKIRRKPGNPDFGG